MQAVGGRRVGCLVMQLQGIARVGEVEAQVFFEDDLQRFVGLYPGESSIVNFGNGDGFGEDVLSDTFQAVFPVGSLGVFFGCEQVDGVNVFVRPGGQGSDDGVDLRSRSRLGGEDGVLGTHPGRRRSCFGQG